MALCELALGSISGGWEEAGDCGPLYFSHSRACYPSTKFKHPKQTLSSLGTKVLIVQSHQSELSNENRPWSLPLGCPAWQGDDVGLECGHSTHLGGMYPPPDGTFP